jgi:hypothetical protein
MMTVTQRLYGRLDNVVGRAEVRLADTEIDDVSTLMGERCRSRQDGKGVFLAKSVEGGNGVEHSADPVWRL